MAEMKAETRAKLNTCPKHITSDLHALLVGTKVGTQVPETTDPDGNEKWSPAS